MRLHLKLGHVATKSKDGTHLLRADVCKAATSIQAQARFTIGGEKRAFPGHAVPCPEVDVSGRLEGSDLSNPCWCLLTTEEARRDRPKDGRCRDVEVHEAGVTQPAQGEGPTLLESTATTAAGPVCRMPSYKPRPLLLIIARQPTSEVKIDTAK